MSRKTDRETSPERRTETENDSELDARLERLLRAYEPPYPSDAEIERTVEAVRTEWKLYRRLPRERFGMLRLLRQVAYDILLTSPAYVVGSALLYVIGLLGLYVQTALLPQFVLFALAPVPFLLGLAEAMRSRDERMLEMEQACRFNGASVLLAKLSLIGGYSIGLNCLAALWLANAGVGARLGELTMLWLLPFTLMSVLALLAVLWLRGSTAVLLMLGVWASCCIVVLTQPLWLRMLLTLPNAVRLPLLAVGGTAMALLMLRLLRQTKDWLGGDRLEMEP